MLDNLLNSVLVLSFLALTAVTSVSAPSDIDREPVSAQNTTRHVAQLERVVVNGRSQRG